MTDMTPSGGLGLLEETEIELAPDTPWCTTVFNDPVNSFPYVIATFMRVLDISKEKAEVLTSQVHFEGKSVVFQGEKDKCEQYAAEFSAAHLWARAERNQ